jgi:hypothetical protein
MVSLIVAITVRRVVSALMLPGAAKRLQRPLIRNAQLRSARLVLSRFTYAGTSPARHRGCQSETLACVVTPDRFTAISHVRPRRGGYDWNGSPKNVTIHRP